MLTDEPAEEEGPYPFDEELATAEGWAKWNRHYWLRDWPGFLEFFFAQAFTEPHSTKQIEDAIGWGLETDPETILRGMDAEWLNDRESALAAVRAGALPGPGHPGDGGRDRRAGAAGRRWPRPSRRRGWSRWRGAATRRTCGTRSRRT